MKVAKRRARPQVVTNPAIRGGRPVIRGTRIPVEIIVASLEAGTSHTQLLAGYPDLTEQSIAAAFAYVQRNARTRPHGRIGEALVGWTSVTQLKGNVTRPGAPGSLADLMAEMPQRLPRAEGWDEILTVELENDLPAREQPARDDPIEQ